MELQVIRHKFASDFFKGFCGEREAEVYSYQLQRMFESGAAKEGDYFVVREGNIPVLRLEISRNNTKRIWESEPVLADRSKCSDDAILKGLGLIFDFLDDETYYSGPNERLEIEVTEQNDYYKVMTSLCEKHGYSGFEKILVYKLKPEVTELNSRCGGCVFRNITELDPEYRFGLVSSRDTFYNLFPNSDPLKLYQDYIEGSYSGEDGWKVIMTGNEVSGFFLPSFTSALKKRLTVAGYFVESPAGSSVLSGMLADIRQYAESNGSEEVLFPVRENDKELISQIISLDGELKRTIMRYAKI